MSKPEHVLSAFDQGQKAGRDQTGPLVVNPFSLGSREHNNFEVGRRFGAEHAATNERSREKPHTLSSGEES